MKEPSKQTAATGHTAYREVTETRDLKSVLNQNERNELANEGARLVVEIAELESQKKSTASSFKSRIEAKETRQLEISRLIQDGYEERPALCQWLFETAGIDNKTGEPIYHPEKKTLVRVDTREIVEIVAMREADYENKELAIADEPPPAPPAPTAEAASAAEADGE